MLYWKITAVTLTALFVAVMIWLYGLRTSIIWALAMGGFLLLLWLATEPLRMRQRRAWREMGLGPDGRPLPEEEEDGSDDDEAPDESSTGAHAAPGDAPPARPDHTPPAGPSAGAEEVAGELRRQDGEQLGR